MFQKSGRNSVSIQAHGNVIGNAVGTNSVVSANGNINIQSGNLSIISDGKTVHIKSKHDLNIYLNDVKVN